MVLCFLLIATNLNVGLNVGFTRTISLISHMAKVLLGVLLCRMKNKTRPEISEKQFGFVADRGSRNAIFTINMFLERSIEEQKGI